MGCDTRWMAAAIRIDDGSKIKMDGGSGNGKRRRNGQRNGKTNPMGKAAAIGGSTRWTAAVITMDGGSKIAMDCGSGNQWTARVPRLTPSSEVVLCPISYCRDVFSPYLGKILDFVVVHWSFIFVSHVSWLIVEFI
jgi:hypothetical protein